MQALSKKQQLLAEDYLPHIIEIRVNADRAALAVLSDVHQGLNDRKLLQNAVEFLLNLGPNTKVILGGDSTNSNTRHSKGSPIEEWASGDKQIEVLIQDIKPLVDSNQLIGILSGNHPNRVYQETFINVEMMLACLLGDKSLYNGPIGIVYFNVNKNLYIHNIMHKGTKKEHGYDFFNADVTWMEHYHKPKTIPKIIVDHNKYTKKPIIKEAWDVYNGSFQIMPDYAKRAGYRPSLPGFYICEMSGIAEKRGVIPWLDHQLHDAIQRGYKI